MINKMKQMSKSKYIYRRKTYWSWEAPCHNNGKTFHQSVQNVAEWYHPGSLQ